MLTKCPDCGTTFRVSPTQLKVRAGTVRCGQCQHVFNALETLADDPVSPITDNSFPLPPIEPPPPAEVSAEPAAEADESSIAETSPIESEPAAIEDRDETASEPDSSDESALSQSAPPDDDYLANPAAEQAAAPVRRWPWLLGSALALCALLLQAVYYYRVELAVLRPDLRPFLQAACKPLNCSVPRPRHIDTLGIETSDLRPDPRQSGHLTLSATLRSKAVFSQEWPMLELTLTDVADRKLAIKHFAASDYLPKDKYGADAITAGFPANGEIPVTLLLDVGDLPAAGYRLYIYYP